MISKLIKIGNSQGVMIPKSLIEEVGLRGSIDIKAENNTIIIKPVERTIREGWGEIFKRMAVVKDDNLLLDLDNQFDNEEWAW